jgi:hypothetical protein
MPVMNKATFDLLDQLYTVAYWMTGSVKKTNDLVFNTYQQVDAETSEVEFFKIFRSVYYKQCFDNTPALAPYRTSENTESLKDENHKHKADGKLAVLFAEVCELKHRAISRILNMPVDTIRLLLTSERKSMLLGAINLMLASLVFAFSLPVKG